MNDEITVRALNTEDLFTLIDISSEMDASSIIDNIIDLTNKTKKDIKLKYNEKEVPKDIQNELTYKIGFKAAFLVIQNLGKAKDKFYKLLSDVSGKTVKEIKSQSLTDTINIIINIVNQQEFHDFLSSLKSKDIS